MEIAFLYPRLKMMSGGEHLLLDWCSAVLGAGHRLTLVTRGVDASCEPYLDPALRIILPRKLAILSGFKLLDSGLDLLYAFSAERNIPDSAEVVVFWNSESLPALFLSKLRRRTFRSIYHCLQRPEFIYGGMRKAVLGGLPLSLLIPFIAPFWVILDKWWARLADVLVTISEHNVEKCNRTYRHGCIVEMPPAISNRPSIPEQAANGENAPVRLLSVGKLIPKKNFDVFIGLIAALCNRGFNVQGTIVGGGPQYERLLEIAKGLGIRERIEFTGYIETDEEVEKKYQNCNIYVYLEEDVPFGLTVLEASARCKPVVALQGGGTSMTLIDNVTGIAAPKLDIAALVESVAPLIRSQDMRERMGKAGRKHARSFSREVLSGSLRLLFAEIQAARWAGLDEKIRKERNRLRQIQGKKNS